MLRLDSRGFEHEPVNEKHIAEYVRTKDLVLSRGSDLSPETLHIERVQYLMDMLYGDDTIFYAKNARGEDLVGRLWLRRADGFAESGLDIGSVDSGWREKEEASREVYKVQRRYAPWGQSAYPVVADFDPATWTVKVGREGDDVRLTPLEFAWLVKNDPSRPYGRPVVLVGDYHAIAENERLIGDQIEEDVFANTANLVALPSLNILSHYGLETDVDISDHGWWAKSIRSAKGVRSEPWRLEKYVSQPFLDEQGRSLGRTFKNLIQINSYDRGAYGGTGLPFVSTYGMHTPPDEYVPGSERRVPWHGENAYFVMMHGTSNSVELPLRKGAAKAISPAEMARELRRRPSLQELSRRSRETGKELSLVLIMCHAASFADSDSPVNVLGRPQPTLRILLGGLSDMVDKGYAANSVIRIADDDDDRRTGVAMKLSVEVSADMPNPMFVELRPFSRKYFNYITKEIGLSIEEAESVMVLLHMLLGEDVEKSPYFLMYAHVLAHVNSLLKWPQWRSGSPENGGGFMKWEHFLTFVKKNADLYRKEFPPMNEIQKVAQERLFKAVFDYSPQDNWFSRWADPPGSARGGVIARSAPGGAAGPSVPRLGVYSQELSTSRAAALEASAPAPEQSSAPNTAVPRMSQDGGRAHGKAPYGDDGSERLSARAPDTSSGKRNDEPRFVVRSGFDVRRFRYGNESIVDLTVRLALAVDEGISAGAMNSMWKSLEYGMLTFFNSNLGNRLPGSRELLRVSVEQVPVEENPHLVVRVVPDNVRGDQRTWWVGANPVFFAHEIAHQLGLRDEYAEHGAAQRADVSGSLMGRQPLLSGSAHIPVESSGLSKLDLLKPGVYLLPKRYRTLLASLIGPPDAPSLESSTGPSREPSAGPSVEVGGEPSRLALHDFYPDAKDWWRLYLHPESLIEAQRLHPSDPGVYYEHSTPGYQEGMLAAYHEFLGTPEAAATPLDADIYQRMHTVVTKAAQKPIRQSGGIRATNLPFLPKKLAGDVKSELIDGRPLVLDARRIDVTTLKGQRPLIYLSTLNGVRRLRTLTTDYAPDDVPKLMKAIFDRHYSQMKEAGNDVQEKLVTIARTTRALYLSQFFTDGNRRISVHLVLPMLLMANGFRPVIPHDDDIFSGGKSAKHIAKSLVRSGARESSRSWEEARGDAIAVTRRHVWVDPVSRPAMRAAAGGEAWPAEPPSRRGPARRWTRYY
ncbi:hypothetical protein ACIQVK_48980 [Streptomyces sp. NPDC090493]|uniref:hypothetical protein n=1 Tax=Streptomyces sp. NPDC090493 TaxID=3365964 RepID=UPI00381F6C77